MYFLYLLLLSSALVIHSAVIERQQSVRVKLPSLNPETAEDRQSGSVDQRCSRFQSVGLWQQIKSLGAVGYQQWSENDFPLLQKASKLAWHYGIYYGIAVEEFNIAIAEDPLRLSLHIIGGGNEESRESLQYAKSLLNAQTPLNQADVSKVFLKGDRTLIAATLIVLVHEQPSLLPKFQERLLEKWPIESSDLELTSSGLDERLFTGLVTSSLAITDECDNQLGPNLLTDLVGITQQFDIYYLCHRKLSFNDEAQRLELCYSLFNGIVNQQLADAAMEEDKALLMAFQLGKQLRFVTSDTEMTQFYERIHSQLVKHLRSKDASSRVSISILQGFVESFSSRFDLKFIKEDQKSMSIMLYFPVDIGTLSSILKPEFYRGNLYFDVLWISVCRREVQSPPEDQEQFIGQVKSQFWTIFANYLAAYWSAVQSGDMESLKILQALTLVMPLTNANVPYNWYSEYMSRLPASTQAIPPKNDKAAQTAFRLHQIERAKNTLDSDDTKGDQKQHEFSIEGLILVLAHPQVYRISSESLMGALTFCIEFGLESATEQITSKLLKQLNWPDYVFREESQPTSALDLHRMVVPETATARFNRKFLNVFRPASRVISDDQVESREARRSQIHQLMKQAYEAKGRDLKLYVRAARIVHFRGPVAFEF
ncbi:hypothetical protein MIR68_005128 [Amoeboaphelidium protococcarum]|nr:hypothetical protein MIR68_005128 [Amoeboaphelidium protococcarum]